MGMSFTRFSHPHTYGTQEEAEEEDYSFRNLHSIFNLDHTKNFH